MRITEGRNFPDQCWTHIHTSKYTQVLTEKELKISTQELMGKLTTGFYIICDNETFYKVTDIYKQTGQMEDDLRFSALQRALSQSSFPDLLLEVFYRLQIIN